MAWNPDCYHQFQSERFAPFEDLAALIKVRPGLSVIDLGCGTGELTAKLADRLPESNVLGIDNSAEMLRRAASQTRPGLRFESASIEEISGRYNIVFSHAAIQWIEDHFALVPRLFAMVDPPGQLAVQLPSNHNHPSHTFLRELAQQAPFQNALGGYVRVPPVLPVDKYAELLFQAGASEITAFEKVYPHILQDADAMAEWNRGTAALPYLERLTPDLQQQFLEQYREKLRQAFPGSPVFYPFRRILFAATRL
jgi:trans-aconitate 2-methyltransferase